LKRKLKKSESSENLLRMQLEEQERAAWTLNEKLKRELDAEKCNGAKLRETISNVEREKVVLSNYVEELMNSLKLGDEREISLKQKIKLLETNNAALLDRHEELESAVTRSLDEAARCSKLKDQLHHHVQTLQEETLDFKREILELKDANEKLISEVKRMTDSERFLTQANQKLWLSLQVNLDCVGREHRDAVDGEQCKGEMKTRRSLSDPHCLVTRRNYAETSKFKDLKATGNCGKLSDPAPAQTCSEVFDSSAATAVEVFVHYAALGLTSALQYFRARYPNVTTEFIRAAIKELLSSRNYFPRK
jgi:chromosome segregation ATPase